MKNWLNRFLKSSKLRSGLAFIITAAVLLELISALQYLYTHNVLESELEHRAETELTLKAIIIKGTFNKTQQLLKDYSWGIIDALPNPDSVAKELSYLVDHNRDILSAGVAFVPNYYPSKGYWFEPFAKIENGKPISMQLAGASHDYTKMEFYDKAIKTGKPCWTDPYVNVAREGSRDSLITTHSMPIIDSNGRVAGVFAVDISLDWLGDTLNTRHVYPSSYNLLLTEGGDLVCKPNSSENDYKDADLVHQLINDSTVVRYKSFTGVSTIIDFCSPYDGEDGFIFYANMRGKPHWQLVVVCYEKEVYGALMRMRRLLMLAMLAAFGLLGFIIYRSVRSERRLYNAAVERERISGELSIARNLQMTMLPVKYPAFPDRNDVDVRGLLKPAREVGGDLYDFFIRDEKLFFAIGDVSGKGVPSALVMSITHALFYSISSNESNPAHIMRALNESAVRNNDSNMFVTFFLGVLDLPTGRLRYCNAGHELPIIIGKQISTLPVETNLPLGIIEDFKYVVQEVILEPHTTIFLYTDGLTEAMDGQHLQFGQQRTLDALMPFCGREDLTLEQLLDTVCEEVNTFVDGAEQSDDLTMLAVRYTPMTETLVSQDSITLQNDLSQVTDLNRFVTSFTNRMKVDTTIESQIKLAVEEAVVNVMNYAYPAGMKGDITIDAASDGNFLKFVITDSGKPFDPTEEGRVDTTLSVEERSIGGLGIFLVRELMDSINYEWVDGKNILTLKKKILTINNSKTNENKH